jgi:hypothetical protein
MGALDILATPKNQRLLVEKIEQPRELKKDQIKKKET